MVKYEWNTFRNYVAFLAGDMAPKTRCPHHDSELISGYHDAFLPWGHYHNNIVLFYHDSPTTRSHFMDPTDRAIKGFYCTFLSSQYGGLHFSQLSLPTIHGKIDALFLIFTEIMFLFPESRKIESSYMTITSLSWCHEHTQYLLHSLWPTLPRQWVFLLARLGSSLHQKSITITNRQVYTPGSWQKADTYSGTQPRTLHILISWHLETFNYIL